MRMTKESKNKTTKVSITLPETNSKTNISSQTPIEIALKIDENGMSSLRSLYEFLRINPSNYSKWCKRNIINPELFMEPRGLSKTLYPYFLNCLIP